MGEVGFLSGEFPKAHLFYSNHGCSEEVYGGGVSCHHFSDCSVLAGVQFLSQHHKPRCLLLYLNDYQHHHLSLSFSLSFLFLSGPINREMRHLISSLQNHNHQLKGDVQRYKRKLRETQMEINKVLLMLVFVDSFMISHNHRIFSGNIQLQKYFITHTHTYTPLSP